jgi:hypothetical protein
MPDQPTPAQILATPMDANDAHATTIRGYLVALLTELWKDGEGFSGKRPFGSSGWEVELYAALARAGHIAGRFDDDGWLEDTDEAAGDKLIAAAIQALGHEATSA